MGIRFWCPNGHKLHVKSFLAGKRGICPECGVKVIIPQESQSGPAEEVDLADLKAAVAENDATRVKLGPPPEPRPAIPPAPSPRPVPEPRVTPEPRPARAPAAPSVTNSPLTVPSPVATREPEVVPPMDRRAVEPAAPSVVPASGAASSSAATGVLPALIVEPVESISSDLPDPFVAAPAAIWYVRPPQGGQYGPATSAVMRGWVEDGRVPPESHVWAEGWPEWRRAVAVIPAAMLDAAGKRLQGAVTLTATTEVPSSSTVLMRRRRTRRWSATVVALLCVLCAILFVALIYVIKFMN